MRGPLGPTKNLCSLWLYTMNFFLKAKILPTNYANWLTTAKARCRTLKLDNANMARTSNTTQPRIVLEKDPVWPETSSGVGGQRGVLPLRGPGHKTTNRFWVLKKKTSTKILLKCAKTSTSPWDELKCAKTSTSPWVETNWVNWIISIPVVFYQEKVFIFAQWNTQRVESPSLGKEWKIKFRKHIKV